MQEFYGDFYALDPHLFSLNLPGSLQLTIPSSSSARFHAFDRSVQGTVAAFLSLKLAPVVRCVCDCCLIMARASMTTNHTRLAWLACLLASV